MKKVSILIVSLVALSLTATGKEYRLSSESNQSNSECIYYSDFNQPINVPINYIANPVEKPRRFIMDIEPLGLLVSRKTVGFKTWTENSSGDTVYQGEVVRNYGYMPGIKMGIGFNTKTIDTDLSLGFGFLENEWFGAYTELSLAPRLKLGKYFKVGPQLALTYFHDGDWEGSHIEMEGGLGSRMGLNILVGTEKVFLSLSVSRVNFAYDVRPGTETHEGGFPWGRSYTHYSYANSDELDISGTRYSIGFYGRF